MKFCSKRNIITTLLISLLVVFIVNISFFKPTKINSYIAANIYKVPANSAFVDDNFYQCVVDEYNYLYSASIPYTANLTEQQLNKVHWLDCPSKKISNTKGLEKLINLTGLDLKYNQITELDLSKNTALKTLMIQSNQLTELDLSNNPALDFLDLNYNQLTKLDVSNNNFLEYLQVRSNKLTSIDLSKNTALEILWLDENQLTKLDVSNNVALTQLNVYSNQITELDISKNTALTHLGASSNKITELDLSKNTALTLLNVSSNQITELDLSKNTALTYLGASSNKITELDLSKNTALTELNLNYNKLTKLDISKNIDLKELYVSGNQLTNLDLSKNVELTRLNINNNQITELDLSKNISLTNLDADKNQITELDLSKNTALKTLWMTENKLAELDLSKNTVLTALYVYDNQITELDVSNNTALTHLGASDNQLTKLDVSNNVALTQLNVSSNQITELDISKNIDLKELYVSGNQITELDISKNTALTLLNVSSNQITELDISKNTALTSLNISSNQLTELDVSKNITLTYLYVYNNKLTEIDVSKNTSLIRLDISENQFKENLIIYKNEKYSVSPDMIKLPEGKKSVYYEISNQNINYDEVDNTIKIDEIGEFTTDITYKHNIGNNNYNNYYSVFYNIKVIELTSSKYTINEENSYIYVGTDNDIDTIKNNITVPDGVDLDINLETNKLKVLNGTTILKEYDLLRISSEKYTIDEENSYIYIGTDNAEDTIKNNIELSSRLTVDVDLENDKLHILKDIELLKEYDILKIESSKYIINEENDYIYVGTDNNIDTIKNNIILSDKLLLNIDLENNKIQINKGNTVLKELDILKIESSKYIINEENSYIYVGTDNNIEIIKNNITVSESVELDINLETNKLKVISENEVLKEFDILKINSDKYPLNQDNNYIYIGSENNIDTIKSNIILSNGLTVNIDLEDDKLQILKGTEVLSDYDILKFNSDKYIINKENKWIYTGLDNTEEVLRENIKVSNSLSLEFNLETNKIKFLYNETILDEYTLTNISINNLKVNNKMIVITESISYDTFITNITTNGVTYEIFNGEEEITTGGINIGMTLKVYKDETLLDNYSITNEYLEFDEELKVEETDTTINKLKEKTTVENILSSIDTSGKVTIVNNKGEELTTDQSIGTGSKVLIELSDRTIEYTLVVSGDVTGDGKINIADVVKIADHTLSGNILESYEEKAAEVTGNDKLNIADVVKIADYTLNKEIEIWK